MCAAMRATARPLEGLVPCSWYSPPFQSGSAMIAWRPTSWKAMFCAEWRAAQAMGTAAHTIGIGRGPLQHLHAAHRAANHTEQLVDAQMLDQPLLRPHHVSDRDQR